MKNRSKIMTATLIAFTMVGTLFVGVQFSPVVDAAAPNIRGCIHGPYEPVYGNSYVYTGSPASYSNASFYPKNFDQSGVGKADVQNYGVCDYSPDGGATFPYAAGWSPAWNAAGEMSAGSTSALGVIVYEVVQGRWSWAGTYNATGSSNMTLTAVSPDNFPSGHLEALPWVEDSVGSKDFTVTESDPIVLYWNGLYNYVSDWPGDAVVSWEGVTGDALKNYTIYESTSEGGPWVPVSWSVGNTPGGSMNLDLGTRTAGDYYFRIGVNYDYPANTGANIVFTYDENTGQADGTFYGPQAPPNCRFPTLYTTTGLGNITHALVTAPAANVELTVNWDCIAMIGDEDGDPDTATAYTAADMAVSIEGVATINYVYQISGWTSSGWQTYARRDGTTGAMIGANGIGDFTLENGESYMIRTDAAGTWNFPWTLFTDQPDWTITGGWNSINCANLNYADSAALLTNYGYLNSIAHWTATGWDTDEGSSNFVLAYYDPGTYDQDKNANGIFVRSTDYSTTYTPSPPVYVP